MPSMTNSIQTHERQIRLSLYQKGLYAKKRFADMLGASAVMKALIEKARKYASHDSNLLIYGETGMEKEVLVQSVHNASRRKNGRRCREYPISRLESRWPASPFPLTRRESN